MKASALSLFALVLTPFLALAQGPADLNTITRVEVRGGTVVITGTKKPNFTTFTMTDPARLVIDISEAVFSGVPEELPVTGGTVTGIRTASYGSEATAIARVLIGFSREVETDFQAQGTTLVVKVLGDAGAPAVAQGPAVQDPAAPSPADAGTPADAAAAAKTDRDAQERAAAQAAAAAKADREAQERAAAQAAAAAKEDRDAQAAAQTQAQAGKEPQAQPQAQAAEPPEKREAGAQAPLRTDEARAAEAEAKKQALAEARARRKAEAEAKKQAQAEARAARAAEVQAQRAAAAQRRADARAAREAQATAEPRAQPEAGEDDAAPAARSGGRNRMTFVGFKQEASSSRVFVRTSGPVRYTVSEGGEGTLILELENTRIDLRNNTRALDTSFFDTAVAAVDPTAGPSRTVRIAIRLKSQVPYQARQEGNEVSLEFPRPSRR